MRGALPTWQILRTASMWRECGGAAVRDSALPALARHDPDVALHPRPCEAGARRRRGGLRLSQPGAQRLRARLGPQRPSRLFRARPDPAPGARAARIVPPPLRDARAATAAASGVGLGFYTFQRFHIDTRSFRRWGSAGPRGNESPCALIERGQDPEAGAAQVAAGLPPPGSAAARAAAPAAARHHPPAPPPDADAIVAIETALAPAPATDAGRGPCGCAMSVAPRSSRAGSVAPTGSTAARPAMRAGAAASACGRGRSRSGDDGRWAIDAAPAHILPPGQSPNPVGA